MLCWGYRYVLSYVFNLFTTSKIYIIFYALEIALLFINDPSALGPWILCCIITYSLSVSSPDWLLKPGHCSLENHLRFPSLSSFGAMAGCGELTLFPHLITPLPTHPHSVQYDDTSLSDSCRSLCRHLHRSPAS